MSHELKGRTARAGFVTVASQGIRFVLTTASMVVLSRLLSPLDYGLVAMVAGVLGFLRIVSDAGLSTAMVQRDQVSPELISTLFWINLGLGATAMLVAVAIAPALALIFHEPRLVAVCLMLSLTFVIDAAVAQHQAMLRREMRFLALAVVDVVSQAVGLAVGVVMAWRGFGYWSLVGMQVASMAAAAIGFCWAYPWLPGRPRWVSEAGSMFRFGAFLTGTNLLNYFFRTTDNLLIGWRWGAAPVGLYQKAYGLLMLPITQINGPFSGVAVAALSRVQTDPARQRRYFLGGYSMATSLTIPVVCSAFVFAEEIIRFLLGEQWLPSVRLFQWLSPAALIGALLNPFGWLWVANGRADQQFRAGLLWTGGIFLGFAAGLPFGPEGVAIGYSAMSLVLAWPICHLALRDTAVTWAEVGKALAFPFLAVALASGMVYGLKAGFASRLPIGVQAMGGLGLTLFLYALLLLVVFRRWPIYRDLFLLLRSGPREGAAVRNESEPVGNVA